MQTHYHRCNFKINVRLRRYQRFSLLLRQCFVRELYCTIRIVFNTLKIIYNDAEIFKLPKFEIHPNTFKISSVIYICVSSMFALS